LKKIQIIVLLVLIVVWFSPPISQGGNMMQSKISNHWLATNKSDYPEVVVKGDPDNEKIQIWVPETYKQEGGLQQKWAIGIPFVYETENHVFNNVPEGWLYITPEKEPENDNTTYRENSAVYEDCYSNKLINPEDGSINLLEPRYSLFSHLSTNVKLCDPPCGSQADGIVYNFRCFDISNNKLRWHIRDTRTKQSNVQPFLPIQYSDGTFIYLNNGVTLFDDRTGEIIRSYDFKLLNGRNEFVYPRIRSILVTDDYLWIQSYYESSLLYRTKIQSRSFFQFDNDYGDFLFDADNLWVESGWRFKKINPKSLEIEEDGSFYDLISEPNPEYYFDFNKSFGYHHVIGKYTPITYYPKTDEGLPARFRYGKEWNGGRDIIDPYYDSDTFQYLFDRENPKKLIEISPAKTDEKRTYTQVVDGELIIQTLEKIMCFDVESLDVKWTIDKSDFINPAETQVYAVDWRGVLVRDVTDDKIARFHCFDVAPKEPEPAPVPPEEEPEPIPEPIPEPEVTIQKIILEFQIDRKSYLIDSYEKFIDVSPLIKNGRTLLPARFVTEPLGGDVSWGATEKKVICVLDENLVEFWIGKPVAMVNGVEVQIDPDNSDVFPIIINDRTMVPMRFLAESLGCSVEWIAESKEIILTYIP
jgi:Copper amine oxidase N-terminal domain